ncbi:response regulator [Candidatus Peregrinibacteria bacterium]|nr:response regulator [Candidatus Peregrinibacteria bacterium]
MLVVDDELENLEAFRVEFGEYFNVSTASSAKEALAFLEAKPDVAVLVVDQRMPEMTGTELLKVVSKKYPNMIRILITAYSDIEVVIEAINAGQVYKYISKPWDHEDVRLSIMRAMENYYLTRERERLVEEKINTVKKVAEANRLASLGMLAAGVAHEINNPLVSIHTFMSLVPKKFSELSLQNRDVYDKSYWVEFFETAQNEMRRIQELIRELLNLSKPPKYDFEETNIEEMIRGEAKVFEGTAKEKDLIFKTEMAGNLPKIRCDRNRIKQVVLNLVLNAFQATSKGGRVTIQTRLPAVCNGSSAVEICVVDTGAGIPKEVQDKIFQPFFSTKQKGTGLGLVVSDLIVKQHGGEIHIQSEVGKGTTFVVSLPLKPLDDFASTTKGKAPETVQP